MKTLLNEIKADLEFFRRNPELPITSIALVAFAVMVAFTGCAPAPASWSDTPNPLDSPLGEPTARELHQENIRAITGNPAYQLAHRSAESH